MTFLLYHEKGRYGLCSQKFSKSHDVFRFQMTREKCGRVYNGKRVFCTWSGVIEFSVSCPTDTPLVKVMVKLNPPTTKRHTHPWSTRKCDTL